MKNNVKKNIAGRADINNRQYLFQVVPFRGPVLKMGKGSFVYDTSGRKFLDMMSGQFSLVFGHSLPEFNDLISSQLDKIIHTSTAHLTEEVLTAVSDMASITGEPLTKTVFLSTGAEAVECALRYAKFFTKKKGIAAISAGYHGLTLAAQSLSFSGQYAVPPVSFSYHLPIPNHVTGGKKLFRQVEDCLDESRRLLNRYKDGMAAIIAEPVISVGGMIFPPKDYFLGLRKLADEAEALLIFDECQTGLARTGKWFAYQHYGIVPDILVTAKAAGLGLPVSAVTFNWKIAAAVEGKYIHFSSHQNDPLGAVVFSFLVSYIKKNGIMDKIKNSGDYLLLRLVELSREENWLIHPRGLGLMLGFDLPEKVFCGGRNPGEELTSCLEKNGVIIQAVRKGKTFRILPSYLISHDEIDLFINALKKSFRQIKR